MALGDSVYITANAVRASGWPLIAYTSIFRPDAFTWRTSAPSVVTVSPVGVIHARSVGTAIIAAYAEGFGDSTAISVARIVQTATITPASVNFSVGDTILLTAHAWDSAGAPISLPNRQTLFSTDGDARITHVWESLPSGARLIALEKGMTHVSWGVGQRCGILSVVVK